MRTELLKNGAFILLFVAIVVCAERLIDAAYNRKSQTKITRLLEHKIDDPIMIWGSSNAQLQIDPKIVSDRTGMSSYNMGWYGTYFEQYSCLIKEYLSYSKKSKCLIICCSLDNLGKNTLISRPDLYLSHLSSKYVYESLHDIEPDQISRARYIPGYKFGLLSRNFYRSIFFANKGEAIDSLRGYEPSDKSWSPAQACDKPFKDMYDEGVYRKFSETVDMAVAKGNVVVIVLPPIYVEGYQKWLNAAFVKNKYKDLTTRNANIHFLDYSTDSVANDRSLFYNYSHMNRRGAVLFSEKLASDVNRILNTGITAQQPSAAN